MTDNPDDPIFSDPTPIALFPVRLETRFFPGTGQPWQLRVRIYPDTLTINSHDDRISELELRTTQQFFDDHKQGGGNPDLERDAYSRLCDRVGEPRAAYLATKLDPSRSESVTTRAPGELAAPTAALLPDRWFATAYAWEPKPDGSRQLVIVGQGFGSAISSTHPLALGVSSNDKPADQGATGLALDAGLHWLRDFEAAEQCGMALRLAVSTDTIARVVVVGVRESISPAAGATAIGDWLTAQRYSQGVAFVTPGTRTRNTGDAPSDFTARPTDHTTAFKTERGTALYSADQACAGSDLAKALGIPADAFARVAHADSIHGGAMADMVTALWPVTWGYYLEQMMKPLDATMQRIVSLDGVAAARQHAIDHLRPGGKLSSLRFGDLAYGVVPVTSWTRYAGTSPVTTALGAILTGVRPIWNRAVQNVAVLADPPTEASLFQVLQQAPSSVEFAAAPVRGPEFFSLLEKLLGPFLVANWMDLRGLMSDAVLAKIGIKTRPRLAGTTSEVGTLGFIVLDGPLVVAHPSETEVLAGTGNYFTWILHAGYGALRDEQFTTAPTYTGDPKTLFYKLLRHAALLTYLRDAEWRMPIFQVFGESEFLSAVTGQPMPTADSLVEPFAPLSQAAFAAALGDMSQPASTLLREFRDALIRLASRPTAELQRLLTETLDTASHRVDAWVCSLANARLAEVRAKTPTGLRYGGYGWIDGLSRAAEQTGTGGAVVDPANQGYLLAPSLAHASTSAVLRSGQLAHDAALDAMHFDLSPARVQTARSLIAGVQTGQPLGALLGYELERALHDAGLDRFIARLRGICPLVAGKGDGGQGPITQLAAANVVDGVALHQMFVAGTLAKHPAVATDYATLAPHLAVLEDAYAAVADVLTAESVHHLVRGDAHRSAAALDPIAAGEALPSRLDFVTTPRTGTTAAHRVIVDLFAKQPKAWAPKTDAIRGLQVRAAVDPQLDAWVGNWLADPKNVRCTVTRADGTGGSEVTFDQLGLSPLDVLALAAPTDAADLTRIVLARAAELGVVESATKASVDLARKPSWNVNIVDVPTLLAAARRITALLAGARAADARDFVPTGTATTSAANATGVDVTELERRATAAVDALSSLVADAASATAADATVALQVQWLWRAAYLGIPGAVPFADDSDLLARVTAVRASLTSRAAALAQVASSSEDDTSEVHVAKALARISAVLGPGVHAIPRFAVLDGPAVAAGFGVALADPLGPITWLQRASRVQPGCARLVRAAMACEALRGPGLLSVRVSQLPFAAGSTWVGTAPDAPNGATSLAIVGGDPGNQTSVPAAGLLLDQWTEVLPRRRETVAAAFHYGAPPGRAPHAILLAVPPNLAKPWTYVDVRLIVNDTYDLATFRAVDQTALFTPSPDPHALNLSQYLPAMYVANNAAHDTVSTTFGPKPQGT